MTEKKLVRLVGGHSDGEPVFVHPAQVVLAVPYERGERQYLTGEWGREDSPPVVTRLIDFDIYERVDEDTFEALVA